MDHKGQTGYTSQVQSADDDSDFQRRKGHCPVSLLVRNGVAPGQVFSPTHQTFSHTLRFCLPFRQLLPLLHWNDANRLAAAKLTSLSFRWDIFTVEWSL